MIQNQSIRRRRTCCHEAPRVYRRSEAEVSARTFFPDAFVSCNQSKSHHLGSCTVDLQLLQFGVLLYVFLGGLRLQMKEHCCRSGGQCQQSLSSKHTEQSKGLRQTNGKHTRAYRCITRDYTGLESQEELNYITVKA